jgi:hypothetical protein
VNWREDVECEWTLTNTESEVNREGDMANTESEVNREGDMANTESEVNREGDTSFETAHSSQYASISQSGNSYPLYGFYSDFEVKGSLIY